MTTDGRVRVVAKGNCLGRQGVCKKSRVYKAPRRIVSLVPAPSPTSAEMLQPMSPVDLSAFSTPPTTPRPPEIAGHQSDQDGAQSQSQSQAQAALRRRSSGLRPLSLTLSDEHRNPGVVIDNSPDAVKTATELQPPSQHSIATKLLHSVTPSQTTTGRPRSATGGHPSGSHGHGMATLSAALASPCFLHSLLDKAGVANWQPSKQNTRSPISAPPAPAQAQLSSDQSASHKHVRVPHPADASSSSSAASSAASTMLTDYDIDDLDDSASNLTRQLAETAVSVREMSKQLGRARVPSNIQNVLIITKARDNRLIKLTRELALYLMLRPRDNGRGLVVYVDAQLRHSKRFDAAGIQRDHPEIFRPFLAKRRTSSNLSAAPSSSSITSMAGKINGGQYPTDEGQLRYWTSDMCTTSPHLFDFVVTLGGDGTVLFASWLFQQIVPPLLPFALGSLGFLTNFDFNDHQAVMESAIESGIRVNLRMRFTCTVYRAVAPSEGKGRKAVKKGDTGEILMRNIEKDGWEALEGGYSTAAHAACKDKEIMCYTTRPVESFEILNDLVVDRGPSPYVSLLELFGDEHHMTTVQADGLCVATPTGSTAYSLSAGGSLVNPEIPAMLITPLCPHTLSFRPMLLPDTMELRICVPYNSRSTAWASFDGRGRIELKQGDHVKVTASKYPFPTVCADKSSTDWFHAISRTLKWNERERQKSFVVVEEGPAKARHAANGTDIESLPEQQEEAEEDEEEEKFDIDDLSSQEQSGSSSTSPSNPNTPPQEASPRTAANALAKGVPGADPHLYNNSAGTDSPDRFHQRVPAPPRMSARHAHFEEAAVHADAARAAAGEKGDRDDIHSPRAVHQSGRSRIPRDRDVDAESMRTPRAFDPSPIRNRHDPQQSSRRAFAVWGNDESDSNASDTESQ
ncbi:ATP-NAD kinase [Exidia glandulosa HHB12029]|uniref:ATP-NAD kinase n=1 Tax=Exidia glandulosa HHB12029 TaxID=1314781 RepID=A0A165CAZ1_EXIGL|nr:ATP-NAD kinase [Exidia glandulosa HHB12029]